MDSAKEILATLNLEMIHEAQRNVDFMRDQDGCEVHVRMIAYDDLANSLV